MTELVNLTCFGCTTHATFSRTKNVVMISPAGTLSRVRSDKQIGAHLSKCQIKTHVQTACESHELNIGFHSFDNGFKQLCK